MPLSDAYIGIVRARAATVLICEGRDDDLDASAQEGTSDRHGFPGGCVPQHRGHHQACRDNGLQVGAGPGADFLE